MVAIIALRPSYNLATEMSCCSWRLPFLPTSQPPAGRRSRRCGSKLVAKQHSIAANRPAELLDEIQSVKILLRA